MTDRLRMVQLPQVTAREPAPTAPAGWLPRPAPFATYDADGPGVAACAAAGARSCTDAGQDPSAEQAPRQQQHDQCVYADRDGGVHEADGVAVGDLQRC